VDVSDEAVESMLAESLEHAFEDVNERVLTEAKLKAQEMLSAVSTALELTGDKIDILEREKILGLAEEVRRAMEAGDRHQLKQANEALDGATQHLAAVVLEKAIGDEQA
jgi:molecular chaperone DnaK